MKNVLILGGTGFIGKYLAESLKQEYGVFIYGRTDPHNDTPFLTGNYIRETEFERLLNERKIDLIYHLVSTTIPKEDTSDIVREAEDNLLPTLRLLEAMRKTGTARLIFVSSGGTVYGESNGRPHLVSDDCAPICGYGMQKLVIEQYLNFYRRRYNLDCRIARLSNPYGVPPKKPRGQGIIPIFLDRLRNGQGITLYGDTVRDYIHIDDAVEALHRFADYTGDRYCLNIGSGRPVRLSELVGLIETTTGKRFVSVTHDSIRKCDVEESILDISETVRTLQWCPKIGLEDGIQRTWTEMTGRKTGYMSSCV